MTYRKRRLLGRFVLTVKNFATSNVNQKQSNGECLMGMFIVLLYYIGRDDRYSTRCIFTYRREAFALLVSIDWAMRRPLTVKRATRVGFTLFMYIPARSQGKLLSRLIDEEVLKSILEHDNSYNYTIVAIWLVIG